MLDQLLDSYPDTVQIVYRHFPLTQHQNASKAAEAAEIAGTMGAFWEYHDLLYETQRAWSNLSAVDAAAYFKQLAQQLDLDVDQFAADLDGNIYTDYVNQHFQESAQLRLGGTPSAIVNGEVLTGQTMPPLDPRVWDAVVQLMMLAERQYAEPPEMLIDVEGTYTAVVEMESGDTFTIELYPQSAPLTVNSFVFLAREGWFDGVSFHRVIPGFVAQTGDPTGTGIGGPGYVIPNEIDPTLTHAEAGMVAMANSGPATNGSQWYITLAAAPHLDGGYTIFGKIIDGMDVVNGITERDSPDSPPGDKIVTVTIIDGQ